MPSYYSVVRFVPSAIAEEFVNIGVLTYGDGRVRGKFLENWRRVEKFADATSLNHARAFQEWVDGSMVVGGHSDKRMKPLDEATVRKLSEEWMGSLQLSPPRASMLDADALLEDIAPNFLIEPEPRRTGYSNKRSVVRAAVDSLHAAIAKGIKPEAHITVKTRSPLSAAVRPRVFDIVVGNGVPKYAVQCFNFDVADPAQVLEQVDATAFAIEDVRKMDKDLPVSAVVSSRTQEAEGCIEQARQTFEQIGVDLVVEATVAQWSTLVATKIAATLR